MKERELSIDLKKEETEFPGGNGTKTT